MKIHQLPRRAKGFTLIELLVVITIIAILAGLSFAGVNLAMKKAKKTQGLVAATSLATAIETFYGEYNRLPDVQGEVETDGGGTKLLQVLLALDGAEDNTRSIIFLQAPEAKGKRGGIGYEGSGDNVEGMWDPFGNPFTVILNTEYEDRLTFSYGSQTVNLRGKQVAVYSPGGDGELNTTDDIKSWD
ncbi:type II secretion system protein [Haloferula sp.]|uniref:type II secretion system protein n=1 Tax=Haloferula sp. TaxID=2497595 RepID=UPI00329BC2BE